jgi:hypothetical protein
MELFLVRNYIEMKFELCIASLVALVERPLLPHNLSRHVDTAVDPYLVCFAGDKTVERLRIASKLGHKATDALPAHVEAVQNYLRR